MSKVVIHDASTHNELVFILYSNGVDVYMTSPDKEVNDYMEEHEVIQSYTLKEFKRLFPEIYKKLGE